MRPLTLLLLLLLVTLGCNKQAPNEYQEIAYASEASGDLRDQLGPKSRVIATVTSGQKLLILERLNRWARVRVLENGGPGTKPPREGWMHQRQMVSEQVFRRFQDLAARSKNQVSQGKGLVRRLANMRLEPGRNTQVFYQLAPDEQFEALKHSIANREATAEEINRGSPESLPEDWLLVRASANRVGWILESLAELTPPLEVARYKESQRIRAWFDIYKEADHDGVVHPWYLWVTVPKLTGATHDFEEIRVFVWNPAASRYETSYRERSLTGFLPIHVLVPDGEKITAPEFSFEYLDGQGTRLVRSYFMIGRQVRLKKDTN